MKKITEEELENWRSLCESATAGPWEVVGNTLYFPGPYPDGKAQREVDWHAFPGNIPTALFISAAREAMPRLIEEVASHEVLINALTRADEALRWVIAEYPSQVRMKMVNHVNTERDAIAEALSAFYPVDEGEDG